ncbi:MAG: bifunctional phosphoribosylaminoimidazolecarboxamide formyltransferase/IMP cyclohydrolase [Lysobacterales bacterium]
MPNTAPQLPRRALLSCSDKTGLIELARALAAAGVELISTGGTAAALRGAGLAVGEVSALTGFPEIMDGRVKTLHPRVHGGLLGRAGQDDAVMAEHGIVAIDLLVVNLYPFAATVARAGVSLAEAIENIDIGGPAMLRAAAKNHERLSVLCDPADYPAYIAALAGGGNNLGDRRRLAAKVFAHTADYDGMIAEWLGLHAEAESDSWPPSLHPRLQRVQTLRYGENPHQSAAVYAAAGETGGVVRATVLQGKQLSFNNLADADAAWSTLALFPERPACVIVKHGNPCGVALADDLAAAYDLAYGTDPISAFGGIIAFNRSVDAATARRVLERQFVEVVLAPQVEAEAQAAFAAKPNVRLLCLPLPAASSAAPMRDFKRIDGAWLVQDKDRDDLRPEHLKVVSARAPEAAELRDLLFAWRVAMMVKSNAIVYARDQRTIGIGAGQMSRVISARIAGIKAEEAGLAVPGAVLASDAFFPFADGIEAAAAAGIRAVIQPGGSLRDREAIACADAHGIAMVFTGIRHFRH